ncbi:MAG TPA: hypothetical protein PK604_14455 [Acetivibrio clariflavus]|nr:hypothetical protein [Acetivibrio clariflavus]
MKLWQKVSIASIVVLLTVVTACSSLLLLYAKSNMVQLTTEQAKTEQWNLSTSFSEMVQYYLSGEINPVVKQSGINYCFKCFANDSSVLVGKEGTIYSSVSINPEKILPIDNFNEQKVLLKKSAAGISS